MKPQDTGSKGSSKLLSLFDEHGEYRKQYQDQASVACEKAEAAIAAAEKE